MNTNIGLAVLLVIVIGVLAFYVITDEDPYVCFCKPAIGGESARWVKNPENATGPCPPPKYVDLVCK